MAQAVVSRRGAAVAALVLILILALGFRVHNVGFGLPSLYDPDEPIFMVKALKLLNDRTLNPGWFGHPGTTTIYLIALIEAAVVAFGIATGRFANIKDFAAQSYADPTLVWVAARLAMVAFGVVCVWLTYLVGRRLFGRNAALVGAALLAINALHILWSQVIRTDIMASVFMLVSLLFAVRAADSGRLRDYLFAGAAAGFAAATKWPTAIVAITLIGAAAYRWSNGRGTARAEARHLAAGLAFILVGMFIASPYIFLDWQRVLANVTGEMSPRHLAQTGTGFFGNLHFYMVRQLAGTMSMLGLLLVIGGALLAAWRFPLSRWTILPLALAFLWLICSQTMIWSRWLLPLLPLFCLFAALAIVTVGERLSRLLKGRARLAALPLVALAAAAPSALAARNAIKEREVDTRALAADWARANVKPGETVLVEHIELSLRNEPWKFLFPIGAPGCMDALKILQSTISHEQVQELRKGSPIVDIGNVAPDRLHSCRADYAIVTYYDLYLSEADQFPLELQNYNRLFRGGRTAALFAPRKGQVGGPVVRVVALSQQSPNESGGNLK